MTVLVTPLSADFGAVITGVKLASLSEVEWTDLEAAFHSYGVLIAPGQHMTATEQVQFGERFGVIEALSGREGFADISNVTTTGEVVGPGEPLFTGLRGNEGWHTDSSNMPLAAKASILSAQVVPAADGETEWADLRGAYDHLDPTMRERIAGLQACHSLYASQAKAGRAVKTGCAYGYHRHGAPVRPLVKIHPATGRAALFVSEDAYRIPGLPDEQAQGLLDALLSFATQQRFTFAHSWQPGDIAVWDNRRVLHRARPYDFTQPRVLRHVRVAGDPATELAPTVPDEFADGHDPDGTGLHA